MHISMDSPYDLYVDRNVVQTIKADLKMLKSYIINAVFPSQKFSMHAHNSLSTQHKKGDCWDGNTQPGVLQRGVECKLFAQCQYTAKVKSRVSLLMHANT
jgi:hypothetical protein